MPGAWTVEDEIRRVDEMLTRVSTALAEGRAHHEGNVADCEATRDELLDLRSLLVMQREATE